MATPKAPKHDFAPAWLKIPDEDSTKPSGPKSAEHPSKSGRKNKKDDYYNYRYGSSEYMYAPLQRQRSFDNYYDERRYSPQKFRHHSVDDDYYNAPYNYPYYNGYYNESYGNHYRSQPSLYREGGSKYTHPNAPGPTAPAPTAPTPRYPGPPACPAQVPVIENYPPPYPYDPYNMYEYYGDPYYPSYMHRAGGQNGGCKRDPTDRPGKSDKQKSAPRKRSSSIEEDFPSLNGDADQQEKSAKPVAGNGAWDKASKTILTPKQPPVDDKPNGESSSTDASEPRTNGSSFKMFKVSKTAKEKSGRMNGSPSPKGPIPLIKNSSKEPVKDESKHQTTTPPMDILNSRIISQPSSRFQDKKSDFLRALRQEKKDRDLIIKSDEYKEHRENHAGSDTCGANCADGLKIERLTNGVNDLSVGSPHAGILSSSLEAEQRLLREMGWEENDDDDYVITDDDVREFQKLSSQIKEQSNGFKKTLPITWSPQHLPMFKNPSGNENANGPLSGASDDSDTDLK